MKVIVNNLAVEYEDRGNGAVMLFLHGWQDNLHTFDPLVSTLSDSWRTIVLDLPGFGKSEFPKNAWGLLEYVEFITAFLKKLGVSPNVLVGHSFGGRICIKGLGTKVFSANKVVLIASAGIAKTGIARSVLFRIAAKIGKIVTSIPPLSFVRTRLQKKLYDQAGSDYMNAGALKKTFLKVVQEDLSHDAQKIEIPSLLVWGSEDTETVLSDGETFARLIKGSRLQVLQGAGHFVHHERSREVIRAIENFLEPVHYLMPLLP